MSVLKFIVYAPYYDENVGGSIVLYKLCNTLNDLGYPAFIWPFGKRRFTWKGACCFWAQALVRFARTRGKIANLHNSTSPVSIASTADIEDAVVVYPETVEGNPLSARRYVRWFLHNPKFHTGIDRDFDGELYFYFIEAFNEHLPKAVCGGRLALLEYFTDIYRVENHGSRSKVCHLIRKGRFRDDLPSFSDVWVLDGLDHKEMAKAFNECAICFIYDPYTLYATYAAMCGCIPVIVPQEGVTKEQWLPEEHLRFGLAYGEEDIPYALSTREQMIARLRKDEESSREVVRQFAEQVRKFFQGTDS